MKFIKNPLIKIIIIVSIFFSLIYINLSPQLQNLRESVFYQIAFRVVITIILLYYGFFQTKIRNNFSLIVILFAVLFTWATFFDFPYKLILLILMIYGYLVLFSSIIIYFISGYSNKLTIIISILSLIISILPALDVTSVDGSTSHFWFPSLMVGSILLIVAGYFSLYKPDLFKEKQNRFAIPLLSLMAGFSLVFLTLNSLNFILDASVSEKVEAVIIDMDVNTGYRQVTSYELKLSMNDEEIELDVSQSQYYRLSLGDTIEISIYDGYFSIPYYVYEGQ